jgi:poly(A) polymerase
MKMQVFIEENIKKSILLIGNLFFKEKESIYLVGGAFRDIILKISPEDLDFTTSASPERIRKIVRPEAEYVYDKSRAKGYGTQGIRLKSGLEIEITPHRHAVAPEFETSEVVAGKDDSSGIRPVTLAEDLSSRDFTINAMAMDVWPERFGETFDPYGGMKDLEARRLRTPAQPMRTFEDDPLRVLRAARFAAKFGLEPDESLLSAISRVVNETGWLDRVAPERVRVEIEKMLLQDRPSRGFALMAEWGLLCVWMPELEKLAKLEPEPGTHHKNVFAHSLDVLDRAAELGPESAPFRFAALLHDVAKSSTRQSTGEGYNFHDHEKVGAETAIEICRRLRFSNDDTEHVADLVGKHHRVSAYTPEWTDSAVRRAVHDLGARYDEIIVLSRADISTSIPEKRAAALARVDEFLSRVNKIELAAVLDPNPPIDGNEIMALLGIERGAAGGGPMVGKAVKFLKDKIVSGELDPADAETAREMVLKRDWNL